MAKTPFKALQAHWYQVLKEEGFTDIEDTSSPNEMLKAWHGGVFQRQVKQGGVERFEARRDYYLMVTHFLETHEFDDDLERMVWYFHSEGKSLREIAKETGKVSKDGALKIIRKLQRAMKDQNTDGH